MLYPTAIKAGMPVSGHPAPTAGLPPALANQPAGTQLNGTIVGGDGAGQLLLRTVAGMVFVNSTLKLARGTVVSLRIRHGATPFLAIDSVISGPAGPAKPGLSPTMASGLNQALGVLRKVDPGLAEGVVRRAMAIPGDKLAGAVLIFMAALKSGDFTAWFGPEAARALESRGRGDLVARLYENFGQLARLAEQPLTDDWQALFVPLHDSERVRQLRFYFRRRRGGDGDRDNRFMVEVESSRLGQLQLDGLVRSDRFDLVLRSHQPLADEVRRDISEIFADGLAITGQTGKIAFKTMESFPTPPLDPMLGQQYQGILV